MRGLRWHTAVAANAESAFLKCSSPHHLLAIRTCNDNINPTSLAGDPSPHLSLLPSCCVGRHCATCLARLREQCAARLYLSSGNSPPRPLLLPTIHLPTEPMRTTSKRCTGTGGRTQSRSISPGTCTSPAWTRAFPARRPFNHPQHSYLLVVLPPWTQDVAQSSTTI